MDKGLLRMRFPNDFDGTMDVTTDELQWLIENGHASVRAEKIRSVTLDKLAKFYAGDPTVEACRDE